MSNEAKYALLYNDFETNPCLRIPFSTFSSLTVCLPLSAFIFCIVYSVLFHFESATYTHCHVYNVLPSISAAIGNFSPQREVWQVAILLQAAPRFGVAMVYQQYHQEILYSKDTFLGNLACFFNIVENVALIVLSFWTSSEHYPVHEKAFVIFIIMSELYMLITCFLQSRYRRPHRLSLWWKKRLVFINISCIILATYFFMRHNSMCEPYVYSLFAFTEYVVVLTNMAFHMTAYMDFRDKDLIVYRYGIALVER